MKYSIFVFCSLILFSRPVSAQDPMLDMNMLFPERAADTLSAPPVPQEISRMLRRIEILEKEVDALKAELVEIRQNERPGNDLPAVDKQIYARALQFFNRDDYASAASLLERLYNTSEDKELKNGALYWMGECAFRIGTYNEAAVYLEELLETEEGPYRENTYILLAVSFRRLGKYPESRQYLNNYLDVFPDGKYAGYARRELEKNP